MWRQVGFPARNPEKLVRALSHTHRTLWIRSTRKSRMARAGQLLGFCRATSDGALSATIWDVAVRAFPPAPTCLFRISYSSLPSLANRSIQDIP